MLVHSKDASSSLGGIVEIVGMKKRSKLNGLIGKVVEERADATGRTYDGRIAGAGGRTHGVLRKVTGTHLSKVEDTSMPVSPMATATEHGASSASATADGTSAVTATELDPDNQTVDLVYDLVLFLSDVLADACTSSPASRSAHDECLDMVYEKL